ncbi:MAG: hypothetical protein ACO388_07525 [Saprospiraceae bacterium]
MNQKDFFNSGLLEQYVLGITSEEESKLVETFIASDPEVRKAYDQLRKEIEQFAESQQINQKRPVFQGKRMLQLMTIIAIALTITNIAQYKSFQIEKSINSALTNNLTACEESKSSESLAVALLNNHDFHLLEQLDERFGQVKLYWHDASNTAMLHLEEVPILPNQEQYEIWEEVDGKMNHLASLDPTGSKKLIQFEMSHLAETINLTLEPKQENKIASNLILQIPILRHQH